MPIFARCIRDTARQICVLSLLLWVCACSSSNSSSPAPDTGDGADVVDGTAGGSAGDNSGEDMEGSLPTDPDLPATGAFDLSQYLFHRDVLSEGGQISWVEKIYGKEDSEDGAFIRLERGFVNNGGTIEESSAGSVIKRFTISNTAISEVFVDPVDTRITQRFADLGETYLNANSTPDPNAPISIVQNATCRLEEALQSFDLSMATGDLTLASGVYEDVIRVYCVTSAVNGDTLSPHTMLNSYFAKDIGIIFSEGEVLFLENVYIVEEY